MKNSACRNATIGLIVSLALVGSAWGEDGPGPSFGVGGKIFAIEGEYLFVVDFLEPILGVSEGDTFENCYTFNEDVVPDELTSGEWIDPLFPGPPGVWVQHTGGPILRYSALADDGAGLTLVQNGTVKPGRSLRSTRGIRWSTGTQELEGFSIVSIAGLGVVAEIVSRGHAVEECPYDLP